ncbi:calcium-binding protein [Pseudooceanicola sp. 502str34]
MAYLEQSFEEFRASLSGAASTYTVDFAALNNSGVLGNAVLALGEPQEDGTQLLTVAVRVTGMEAGAPVPQHIHGLFDEDGNPIDSMAPTIASDADGDGMVEVLEGVPSYGDVLLSMGADDGLPTTEADGSFTYIRSFNVNDASLFGSPVTGADYDGADIMPLALREIVLHGVNVQPGIGEGTGGEIDGSQDGFVPILPAAAGSIEIARLDEALEVLGTMQASLGVEVMLGDDGNDVSGTEGDDVIEGGAGDDVIAGLAGRDMLTGNGGMDVIDGGWGDDTVMAGDDTNMENGADSGASGALPLSEYDNGYAGGAGNDMLVGGAGDDIITGDDESRVSTVTGETFDAGADGSDTIYGGAGNDEIHTGSWADGDDGFGNTHTGMMDDTAYGGDGDDILRGAGGNDWLSGDAGNDNIGGGGGHDTIAGGMGDDSLFGNAGMDFVSGGMGNDTIEAGSGDENTPTRSDWGASGALPIEDYDNGSAGGAGDDLIRGGDGDDLITGDDDSRVSAHTGETFDQMADGSDTIFGGAGNDEIHTGSWGDGDQGLGNTNSGMMADVAYGGDGNDILRGAGGNDRLFGDAGNDNIGGGGGSDTIMGGTGDDFLFSGGGDSDTADMFYGGAGNDTIEGGAGNDAAWGGSGNDMISGGAGSDTLAGNEGNDVVSGGALADFLFGGTGDDFINGGFGHDELYGGAGADRFFHAGAEGHGTDWIGDYDASEGDVLLFTAGQTVDNLGVNFANSGAGDAGTDELFVSDLTTGQTLFALVDGADLTSLNVMINGSEYDLLV